MTCRSDGTTFGRSLLVAFTLVLFVLASLATGRASAHLTSCSVPRDPSSTIWFLCHPAPVGVSSQNLASQAGVRAASTSAAPWRFAVGITTRVGGTPGGGGITGWFYDTNYHFLPGPTPFFAASSIYVDHAGSGTRIFYANHWQ